MADFTTNNDTMIAYVDTGTVYIKECKFHIILVFKWCYYDFIDLLSADS